MASVCSNVFLIIGPLQINSRDAAELVTPKNRPMGIIPRRVIALRTSPFGRYPLLNAAPPPAAPQSQVPVAVVVQASVTQSGVSPSSQAPEQSSSRLIGLGHPSSSKRVPASLEVDRHQSSSRTIGLGHPSTTNRRAVPAKKDCPASAQGIQPRRSSSTIKRRTQRLPGSPGRELYVILEDPVAPQPSVSRPVSGTRRRSYAMATTTEETPKKSTGRRVSPTPSSPRCAQRLANTSVSYDIALAPRYTSSVSPQAGPTQLQSPCALACSPRFQSLDGAVEAIIAARDSVEGNEGEEFCGEIRFTKAQAPATLQLKSAAHRMKMLF